MIHLSDANAAVLRGAPRSSPSHQNDFRTKEYKKMTRIRLISATIATLGVATATLAATPSKPATPFTKQANLQVLQELPFADKQDFADAQRGLIAKEDVVTIKDAKGNVVWDLEQYKQYIGLDKAAPDTVNPSLWRNAQLSLINGLFKVTDRIYQVRGYDLSNITFVQGDTGWIVFDPLISPETACAGCACG